MDQLIFYMAGWNMPGYLPETDPEQFTSFEDAREYLLDYLLMFQDNDYDLSEPGETDRFEALIEDLRSARVNGPWAGLTADGSLAFWIMLEPQ